MKRLCQKDRQVDILVGEPEEPVGDGSEGSLQSWGAKVWRKWRQQQVREEFREVKGEGAKPGWERAWGSMGQGGWCRRAGRYTRTRKTH